MGLIFDDNVKESKIYQAYDLTVYGRINTYEWTIHNCQRENALTTIRIVDANENDVFSMYLGNNCILQAQIDNTMDNFLWWIAEDKPDSYMIEKQVYDSLCASNCLFNSRIQNRKLKQKRENERKKQITEREAIESEKKEKIKAFCREKVLIPCFTFDCVYLIKSCNEKAKSLLETTDAHQMESLVNFAKQYLDNKDIHIVANGTIDEILVYIAKSK